MCKGENAFGTSKSKPGRQHRSPPQSRGAQALREGRVSVNHVSATLPELHSPLPAQSPVTSASNSWPATVDTDPRPRMASAQAGGCFATPVACLSQSRRVEVFEHSSFLISWVKVFGIA